MTATKTYVPRSISQRSGQRKQLFLKDSQRHDDSVFSRDLLHQCAVQI
jgi:hypothetical protein